MRNIAFFCIPAWGHTNPTVEVVRRLVQLGHRVRYYSFAPFREKLESAGAEVILCDEYLPPAPEDLDEKVGKDFAALVEMVADTTLALEGAVLPELKEFRPDVIVSDSLCFWGKLFAGKLGVPYVCSTTSFAFNSHTAKLMKPKGKELVHSILGMPRIQRKMKLLREHGYPVKSFVDLIQNDNETNTIVYTSREFQPMPETFGDTYVFVGPSLPSAVNESEKCFRPLVYISLGTLMHHGKGKLYQNCLQALADLDADVVMSVGTEENLMLLGALPANVTAKTRVDQLDVLSRADAFITHCGMNSASEAVWFGVPTVLYPLQSEEAVVADRMEDLGVGVRLRSERPAEIRQAVEEVLRNSVYHENTVKLGDTFRAAGGAERAVEQLLAWCES